MHNALFATVLSSLYIFVLWLTWDDPNTTWWVNSIFVFGAAYRLWELSVENLLLREENDDIKNPNRKK